MKIMELCAIFALVLAFFAAFASGIDIYQCRSLQSRSGVETRWAWYQCLANVGGQFVPFDYAVDSEQHVRLKAKPAPPRQPHP